MSLRIWRDGSLHPLDWAPPGGRLLKLAEPKTDEDVALREVVYESRRFTDGSTIYATPEAWASSMDEIIEALRAASKT